MLDFLKELIRCYEHQHGAKNSLLSECLMWRQRFIADEKDGQVKIKFMSTPADYFESNSPDEILKQIKQQPHQ